MAICKEKCKSISLKADTAFALNSSTFISAPKKKILQLMIVPNNRQCNWSEEIWTNGDSSMFYAS